MAGGMTDDGQTFDANKKLTVENPLRLKYK
jgi:hypothetical protein